MNIDISEMFKKLQSDLSFGKNAEKIVEEIIKKVLPDYIFNFSSAQPQFEKDNSNYFKINTIPTIKILDSILKYKKTRVDFF